jgi:predicted ATP-dependent protease
MSSSVQPGSSTMTGDSSFLENALARLTGTLEPGTTQALLTKLKPEHLTALLELQKLSQTQLHDVEMARIQTSSAAEQERIKQQAAAEQLRLKNDAELTRAGPRLVLLLIVIAFVFILLASAVFLGFQKPDLLPQIITAGLGLVTGLAGGYGIGRATSPSPKP